MIGSISRIAPKPHKQLFKEVAMECPHFVGMFMKYCVAEREAYIPSLYEMRNIANRCGTGFAALHAEQLCANIEGQCAGRPRQRERQKSSITMRGAMNKKRILIVDDDAGALECVHEILTRHGYEAVSFTDTSAALDMVASGISLDLAIIDLILPEMNGLELHARIRQMRPGLPCIMVTGYGSVESYLNAINNGVFEYLNKPFRSRELKTVVAAALKKTEMMNGGGPGQIHEPDVHRTPALRADGRSCFHEWS